MLNHETNIVSIKSKRPIIPNANPHPKNQSETFDIGPIEKQMREKLATLENCKYPDTFNWSVYDQIAKRYKDAPPRGGVVFKTTFKLVNHHSSCSKCHYAFEIDTYGRGCVHNCIYCYAKDQLSSHGYWNRPMPFPVDISEVRKIMYTVFETEKPSKWRSILDKKVPVRIGSMSDSFMWMDSKYKVTQELLKILKFYKYPYIIFTRSDLVATSDYLELLDKDLSSIQFSISGNNDELTKVIEPGAPSVKKRIEALKKLNQNGFWTTVRINPLFPVYPDGYFTDRESIINRFGSIESVPTFNFCDSSLLDQLKDAGVPSVLAGFVRLSPWAINNITAATGIDLKAFYKPEMYKQPGDKKYSDPEIAVYYMKLKTECAKRGIRFNTCFIGNGIKDYYQYQSLWDNKSDCCDVKGNIEAFQNTSQSIPWEERMRHAPCKVSAQKSKSEEEKAESRFDGPIGMNLHQQPEIQV